MDGEVCDAGGDDQDGGIGEELVVGLGVLGDVLWDGAGPGGDNDQVGRGAFCATLGLGDPRGGGGCFDGDCWAVGDRSAAGFKLLVLEVDGWAEGGEARDEDGLGGLAVGAFAGLFQPTRYAHYGNCLVAFHGSKGDVV